MKINPEIIVAKTAIFLFLTVDNPKRNLAANLTVKFGDWLLTPLRYVTHAPDVSLSISYHGKNEHLYKVEDHQHVGERNWVRMAAAILFILPGVIMGAAFKGLGYLLSHEVRHEPKKLYEYAKVVSENYFIGQLNLNQTPPIGAKLPILNLNLARVYFVKTEMAIFSPENFESHMANLVYNLQGRGLEEQNLHLKEGFVLEDIPYLETLDPRKLVIQGGQFKPSETLAQTLEKMGYLMEEGQVVATPLSSEEEIQSTRLYLNTLTHKLARQVFLLPQEP